MKVRTAGVALGLTLMLFLGACGATTATSHTELAPTAVPGIKAWTVGGNGAILASSDGGASWKPQSYHPGYDLEDVAFADSATGWAVGTGGTVMATTDGGATWTRRRQATDEYLRYVACLDAQHVWVVGEVITQKGKRTSEFIMASGNGGTTWTKRELLPRGTPADIVFTDHRHGWIVDDNLLRTTADGGRTWQVQYRPRHEVLVGITFSRTDNPAGRLWLVGDGGGDMADSFALRSDDGGANWTKQSLGGQGAGPDVFSAGAVTSTDALHVWVAGNATDGRCITASVDGGDTWARQETPAGVDTCGPIAFCDPKHGLSLVMGQPILATSDGGADWRAYGMKHWRGCPLFGLAVVDDR